MWVVDMLHRILGHKGRSADQMEEHLQEVKHDLTNLKARADVISRLVVQMQDDGDRSK